MHSVALKNDGTIKSWGNNDENQLDGAPIDGGYVAIACGQYHNIALKMMVIIGWGDNQQNQLSNIPTDSGYVAIACEYYGVALKNDGTINIGVIIDFIN